MSDPKESSRLEPDPDESRWLLPSQQRGLVLVLGGLLLLLTVGAWRETWMGRRVDIRRLPARPLEFRLDLNRANKFELVQLPGIGPKLAETIVKNRETLGPFESVEDLTRVPGIGDAKLAPVRPYLFVSAPAAPGP